MYKSIITVETFNTSFFNNWTTQQKIIKDIEKNQHHHPTWSTSSKRQTIATHPTWKIIWLVLWLLALLVLEKTLESPLNCKEIKPVNPKGSQSWLFIGRTDAEAETPYLGHQMWRADSLEKTDAGKD